VRRWLLDTNVISELRKTRCHEAVKTWSEALAPELLYLSRITIAAIRFAIEQHAGESFRGKLETGLDEELSMRRSSWNGGGWCDAAKRLAVASPSRICSSPPRRPSAGSLGSPGTSRTSRLPVCRFSIPGPVNSGPDGARAWRHAAKSAS
jgi:hypothetical protein